MKNLKTVILIILLSVFSLSCSSYAKKMLKSYGVSNQIYLHPDAKVGDYLFVEAIFKQISNVKLKYKIIDIKNDIFIVDEITSPVKIQYHLKRDINSGFAKVIKAYWINDDNTKEELNVAIRGERLYTNFQKINQAKVPFPVKTKNGEKTFDCDVYCSSHDMEQIGDKSFFHLIQFVDPKLKFGIVYRFSIDVTAINERYSGPIKTIEEMKEIIDYIKQLNKSDEYIVPLLNYYEDGNE